MPSSTDPLPKHCPRTLTKCQNGSPEVSTISSQTTSLSGPWSGSRASSQLFVLRRRRSDEVLSQQRGQRHRYSSVDRQLAGYRLGDDPKTPQKEIGCGHIDFKTHVDGPSSSPQKSHPPKLVLDTKINISRTSEIPKYAPGAADRELRLQGLPLPKNGGRRKTMRTVSHDDYLLARGANPRTGVVTPSVHSGSNSLEDAEWLRITGKAAPAKWRLKGDQWVSLGIDEPSPLPSPPYQRDGRHGRHLRMPPRLTDPRQAPPHQRSGYKERRNRNLAQGLPKQHSVDSGQQRRIAPSGPRNLKSDSYGDVVIRRKPLPATFSVIGHDIRQREDEAEASTETVIKKIDPSKMRSSSMPTPGKTRLPVPAATKALPAIPMPEPKFVKSRLAQQDSSFLGLGPGDWIEDIPTQMNGILAGFVPGPPCPPTSDIQSRSKPSQLPRLYGMQTQNHGQPPTTHSSFAMQRPNRLGTSPERFPQPNLLMRPNRRMSPTVSHTMPLTGRGPSRPQWRNQNVQLSPVMSEGGHGMSEPSTITPTTIPTTTNMLPGDRLVSSSWREIPSSWPSQGPKLVRPGMPGRTDGTNSVPQVSPLGEEFPPQLWRATGINDSEISAITSSRKTNPEREHDLIPGPLRPTDAHAARIGHLSGVAVQDGRMDPSSLTCSRPRGEGLTVKPLNMPGSIPMPEGGRHENHDPFTDFASGQIIKDHSHCCPECCEIGCHGSCLGHPSPPVTPMANIGHRFGTMGQAFRNSIRLSRRIRTRKSAGGSQETETEEMAELETPLAWEQSGPVSLGFPACSGRPNHWSCFGGPVQPGRRIASNGSARSVRTGDLPPLQGVGGALEALLVPLGALRMWLRKHPQLLALVSLGLVRLVEMGVHVLNTVRKVYSVAYVYSKTGKINTGRAQGLGGFTSDCVRAVVYALVLAAIATVLGRILAVLVGAGAWVVWSVGLMAWVVKGAGMGMLW